MITSKWLFRSCVLAGFLVLSACGGSGGSNPSPQASSPPPPPPPAPTGPTISGTATAPGGTVAQLQGSSFYYSLLNMLVQPVYADMLGLQTVNNATVELIQIDDDGNLVGTVLATTTTSATGSYTLTLPFGQDFSADLMVRITGTGTELRAMVVQQTVDINPLSHFVLWKVVGSGVSLELLAVDIVINLLDRVNEFDITAEPGFNLAAVLARIEADLGGLIDNEIVLVKNGIASDLDVAHIAGDWHSFELGIGWVDVEDESAGSFIMGLGKTALGINSAGGEGSLNLISANGAHYTTSLSTVLENAPPASTELTYDEDLGSGGEEISGELIASSNNFMVHLPFEEEVDEFIGIRLAPGIATVDNNNNLFAVSSYIRPGAFYFAENGVISPEIKLGDIIEANLTVMLKQGEGLSESNLDGNYGLLTLGFGVGEGSLQFSSEVGLATFDGTGDVNYGPTDIKGFVRDSDLINFSSAAVDHVSDTDTGTDTYTVSPSGELTVFDLEGWTNGYSLIAGSANAVGSPVNFVDKTILIGVTVPADPIPDIDGVYNLFAMLFGVDNAGSSTIQTLAGNSTMTIAGQEVMIDYNVRGYERATDISAIDAVIGSETLELFLDTLGSGSDGRIEAAGDGYTLDGFIFQNQNMMLLRLWNDGGTDRQFGGFLVAVRVW